MSDEKSVIMTEVLAKQIPPIRYQFTRDWGIKQIMMTTWGGLGDQVVAEPTLRHAFKLFPDFEICLGTSFPELFEHLPFKKVYSKKELIEMDENEWLVLHTNARHGMMARDFLLHHFTGAVDFCSLSAIQRQLPIKDRELIISKSTPKEFISRFPDRNPPRLVVHPGRHWSSKTFPKWWWDEVLKRLCYIYPGVAIVGKDVDAETGTVDVEVPSNCWDLRNQLSLKELSFVLQEADVVITNDSAPLHIAAAGEARILFIATCKEPDHLYHWRSGQFGWEMYNLGRDGLWNHLSLSPIRNFDLNIDILPEGLMEKILPFVGDVVTAVEASMHEVRNFEKTGTFSCE